MRVILADRLYIKKSDMRKIPKQERRSIFRLFEKSIFDMSLCETYARGIKCNAIKSAIANGERAFSVCRKCPRSREIIKCYTISKDYVKFSAYDKDNVDLLLAILNKYEKVEFIDKRVLPEIEPFKIKWEALSEPKRSSQKELAKKWLKNKIGLLIAPPRYGKTVLSCMAVAKLHTRILILAHQIELLEQFKKDYLFASTLTEKDIVINPKVDDIDKYKVVLVTYHQFLSKYGKERLKKAKKLFGCIVVDEVHHVGASAYSRVVDSFWAKYRLGITATPNRRDQKEFRVYNIFGQVSSEGGSEQLTCNYKIMETQIKHPVYRDMRNKEWNFLRSWFVKNKNRNEFIVDRIIKDVVNKDRKIFVPLIRLDHINELMNLLSTKCKKLGYNISMASFHGRLGSAKLREEVVDGIRHGKYDVVFAMESMIKEGLTAPPMDCIYLNVGNYQYDNHKMYQLYSRIRTPMEGKRTPLIRVFNDDGSLSEKSISKCKVEFEKRKFSELKSKVKSKHLW